MARAPAPGRSRDAPASPHPIVFYDGACGFCHASVRFLLARDVAGTLRFAPLQGELATRVLAPGDRNTGANGSVVLLEPGAGGRVSRQSEAALRALGYLPPPWRWLRPLVRARVLAPLLDLAYRLVARNRLRWFGTADACTVPEPRQRERFLA